MCLDPVDGAFLPSIAAERRIVMYLARHATRNPCRHGRCVVILIVALLTGVGTSTHAAPMQGSLTPATANSPKSGPAAPPVGLTNAPRDPNQISKEHEDQYSLMTDREQQVSYAILLFGTAVLIVQYLLLRSPKRNSYEILQLLAINLIVTGTLFLISAGYSAQAISPGLGLFGTIAGYVLGRRAGDTPTSGKPEDKERGAP